MYYCKDCKELIENDELEEADEGFYTEVWGHNCYNEYSTVRCPYCGSDDIEEAPRCEHCHDYFVPTDDDKDLCEECLDLLKDEGEE